MKTSTKSNNLVFLLSSIYFVQGAVIITGLAEFFLTRNIFEFSWIQIALLSALGTLTWSVKPLYGFVTDLLPLGGYRRKSYLILSAILPFCAYFYLAFFGVNFLQIALSLILINIGIGFADVIIDGLIVETAPPEKVGLYQSFCWRAKAIGIFIATLFSGIILERKIFSQILNSETIINLQKIFPQAFPDILEITNINIIDIRFTFLLAGVLPLSTLIVSFFLKEKKISKSQLQKNKKNISKTYLISALLAFILTIITLISTSTIKSQIIPFLKNDQLSSLLLIIIWTSWISFYTNHLIKIKAASSALVFAGIFLFLWRFTPRFGAPWNDYFLNTLQLSQEKMGLISSITPLAWIIGSFIYNKYFNSVKIKNILFWTVITSSLLGILQLPLASPELAEKLGSLTFIKYPAALFLLPAYLITYNTSAWTELMTQSPIIHLEAFLSLGLEIVFMIAFLPLFRLAALVTPKGVEATNFAILASIMNLGLAFGSVSGGIIYTYIEGSYNFINISFNGLHLTILIGALTSLACLAVLPKINLK